MPERHNSTNFMNTIAKPGMLLSDVVAELLRALSSEKDEIQVREAESTRAIIFSIKTSHRDYPRVIGTGAKNFKALDLLVKLMAAREDLEARLSVLPPKDKTRPEQEIFEPNPAWGKEQIKPLLQMVCERIFDSAGVMDIKVIDDATLSVEIKVNADDLRLYVIDCGVHVPVGVSQVEAAMKAIFFAIGKAGGKNVFLDIIALNIPEQQSSRWGNRK